MHFPCLLSINNKCRQIMFAEVFIGSFHFFIFLAFQSSKPKFRQLYKSFLICLFLLFSLQITLLGQEKEFNDFHQNFVDEMIPKIREVNAEIEAQRDFAIGIIQKYNQQERITDEDKLWFTRLLRYYRIDFDTPFDSLIASPQCKQELLLRVDVIPEKVAIAQAAIESGWGQSRFAKEGNSYFGIRCGRPGCGIEPNAAKNQGIYVKSYESVYECVKHYAKFLNAGTYYSDFRKRRQQNRTEGNELDPLFIAEGLKMYSSKREVYVKHLKTIILYNFSDL